MEVKVPEYREAIECPFYSREHVEMFVDADGNERGDLIFDFCQATPELAANKATCPWFGLCNDCEIFKERTE